MIEADKNKCLRCGLCVQDCVVEILKPGKDNVPFLAPELEKFCINCQHCLAVCPAGAITCRGVSAAECLPAGPLPEPEKMLDLLRQRRSIRQYKNERISPEILDRLKSSLAWAPTGCNDHSLIFKLVDSEEEMEFFRSETNKMLNFLIKTGILRLLYPNINRFLEEIRSGKDVIYRNAPYMLITAVSAKAPCKEADPWIASSYFDLLLQSYGLGSCWCGFAVYILRFNRKLRRHLALPKGYRTASVLLFGSPAVTYPRATSPRDVRFLPFSSGRK